MTTETTDALTTDELVTLAGVMGWKQTKPYGPTLKDRFSIDERRQLWIAINGIARRWNPCADTPAGLWQAKQLAKKWKAGRSGRRCNVHSGDGVETVTLLESTSHWVAAADTEPLAICRAVLAAVGEQP